MNAENESNRTLMDEIGISIGGQFSDLRKLTICLDEYFISNDSHLSLNTIIKSSYKSYSLRKTIDEIYENINHGESAIMILTLVVNPKYQRFLIQEADSHIDHYYNLLSFVQHLVSHYLNPALRIIRQLSHYMEDFLKSGDSTVNLDTIVGNKNYPYSIREVLNEINLCTSHLRQLTDSLRSDLETDQSGINAIVTKFLIKITHQDVSPE